MKSYLKSHFPQRFSQPLRGAMFALLLIGIVFWPREANANDSQITATIAGLRNQQGQLCLTLFAEESGFPEEAEAAIAAQCIQVDQATQGVIFKNLKPGDYAIAAVHDANHDGKLNTGFLGIPQEGFGFSRNPRILTGAPQFKEAAFSLGSTSQAIEIQMRYF